MARKPTPKLTPRLDVHYRAAQLLKKHKDAILRDKRKIPKELKKEKLNARPHLKEIPKSAAKYGTLGGITGAIAFGPIGLAAGAGIGAAAGLSMELLIHHRWEHEQVSATIAINAAKQLVKNAKKQKKHITSKDVDNKIDELLREGRLTQGNLRLPKLSHEDE